MPRTSAAWRRFQRASDKAFAVDDVNARHYIQRAVSNRDAAGVVSRRDGDRGTVVNPDSAQVVRGIPARCGKRCKGVGDGVRLVVASPQDMLNATVKHGKLPK